METLRLKECINCLDELKRDAKEIQKNGLPFMLSSVIIWAVILTIQFMKKQVVSLNLYTFMSSCLLMPLAFFFSKLIKADIFKKTANPVNRLGFLCTMNQTLYLIIVMWAYSKNPGAMVMLYAMVFGAHLLPFGWVYDSKAYIVISIIETIGAMITALVWGNVMAVAFMIIMEIILCIFLFTENRKLSLSLSE